MSSETPPAILSITELATQSNEVYISFRRAGFTSRQSIYMAACAMTGSPGAPPDDGELSPE